MVVESESDPSELVQELKAQNAILRGQVAGYESRIKSLEQAIGKDKKREKKDSGIECGILKHEDGDGEIQILGRGKVVCPYVGTHEGTLTGTFQYCKLLGGKPLSGTMEECRHSRYRG